MHRVQRECKINVLQEEIVYADLNCFHILLRSKVNQFIEEI